MGEPSNDRPEQLPPQGFPNESEPFLQSGGRAQDAVDVKGNSEGLSDIEGWVDPPVRDPDHEVGPNARTCDLLSELPRQSARSGHADNLFFG
jgi:hypothetical protein